MFDWFVYHNPEGDFRLDVHFDVEVWKFALVSLAITGFITGCIYTAFMS
jgi:hypothetical protein